MTKIFLLAGCLAIINFLAAQSVSEDLQKAFSQFEKDGQLKHAISSLYVIDAKTGQVVFDKNSQIGLAGASTQKIVTAATAFELLGQGFRFKTSVGYRGEISNGTLNGDIVVLGSHDPSFGSWRWPGTSETKIITDFASAIRKEGIKAIHGGVAVYKENESPQIPDRWIIQDIGNYYGAGSGKLNWRENQFDVFLRSGKKIGDPVEIVRYIPYLYKAGYVSKLSSAAAGTGDNAYIYLYPKEIRGTIPINENNFKISGAMEDPAGQFLQTLTDTLSGSILLDKTAKVQFNLEHTDFFYQHYSPALDSIIYWFLKKSINLYGEALLKTLSYEQNYHDDTDSGIAIIRKFWKDKGIDEDELNIYDGSGLSPMNRLTTHAQVEILKYAKTRPWYKYYLEAFPDYNGMKMKSGTIGDVKGFCGYHKAKDGREYIFSFLVNNYNGKTSGVISKMYKVLDELK